MVNETRSVIWRRLQVINRLKVALAMTFAMVTSAHSASSVAVKVWFVLCLKPRFPRVEGSPIFPLLFTALSSTAQARHYGVCEPDPPITSCFRLLRFLAPSLATRN